MKFDGKPGKYNLRVQYFDLNNRLQMKLTIAGKVADMWTAPGHYPAKKIDASSSTRHTIEAVTLRPGDEIRIDSAAAFDYLELLPN